MGGWKEVRSQQDMEELLGAYAGFHDSCLVSMDYRSGAFVDEAGGMHCGAPADYALSLRFHSQGERAELELNFTGLRRVALTGWQDNYAPDIFDARLEFWEGKLGGQPYRGILWADAGGYAPEMEGVFSRSPGPTCVLADALRWRFNGAAGAK